MAFVAKPAVTAAQAKIQIAKDTVGAFLVESSLSELQNANTPTGIRTMLQKSRVAMPGPRFARKMLVSLSGSKKPKGGAPSAPPPLAATGC